jgi:hypothetical protein
MFWQTQLKAIEDRKRRLASECDLERTLIAVHAAEVARSLHWVDTARSVYLKARPWIWLGAPVAGLVLGRRLPRLARWSALAAPVIRGLRALTLLRRVPRPR